MPSRTEKWLWPLVIAAAVTAVYASTLGYGFAFDDGIEIVNNGSIRSLAEIPKLFTSTIWRGGGLENSLYRPLVATTYALNYALSGLQPFGYHLFNLLLHLGVCLLLYRLAQTWGLARGVAGLAAILFAVLPVHVEAVANVVGRRDLLAAVFVLAMLLAHARAQRRALWLVAALLAYTAAMFSKETGIVAIGLIVAQDALTDAGTKMRIGRRLALLAAYATLAAGYLLGRSAVVGGFGIGDIPFIDNPLAQAPTATRLLTATAVVGRGLVLQLLPLRLLPDYSYNVIPIISQPFDWTFLASSAGLLALGIYLLRARPRLLLFVAAWYAICLAPVANILLPIGTIFGERLLYLPSIATCTVAAVLLAKVLSKRPRMRLCAAALLVVSFGTRAVVYSRHWKNDETLASYVATAAPRSAKAQHLLAVSLHKAKRPREALAAVDRALAIWPRFYHARGLRGALYREQGRLELAGRELERAVALEPKRGIEAIYQLAVVRRLQRHGPQADALLHRVLAARPNHIRALGDLGSSHFVRQNWAAAEAAWLRVTRLDPRLPTAWYNLGLLYQRQGRVDAARRVYRTFLRVADDRYAAQKKALRRRLGAPQ